MITIIMSGPQGIGKTALAQKLYDLLKSAGQSNVRIYTTNETVPIPPGAYLELKKDRI